MTEPNEKGRQYRHGTLTAYNAAKCRCEHCRGAYADYRARRRAGGKDSPRDPAGRDTDGHIPADWFRNQVWYPARKAAGLDRVRIHDLRHAHASWLLAGGADLQVVKERLGHASIVHHGEVPAQPAHRRRDRAGCPHQDPQPRDGQVGMNPGHARAALYAIVAPS